MNRVRRNRLFAVVFLVVGAAATVGMVLVALNENINLFYPPDQVVGGDAPLNTRIRAGGMVEDGSVKRAGEGLTVEFVLTDHAGSSFPVEYTGILPDLFREGQGILVTGELRDDGVFQAREVLAKHDETYMPPELAQLKQAQQQDAADAQPAGEAPYGTGAPGMAPPGGAGSGGAGPPYGTVDPQPVGSLPDTAPEAGS
jgi:cytochrome c-type biogenesis protein CcmE